MYRRDIRDTACDDLLADAAVADAAVQALPGPGGRIAYAAGREGQVDLWLCGDGRDTRLTAGGVLAMRYGRGDPQWFDWAPAGDRIAYLTADANAATVDVTTGEKRTLTEYNDRDQALSWSPDGEELAVVTDRFSRASLALIAADGSRVEALADDDFLYGDPRWGPDGVYAVRSEHRHLFDFESALVRADPASASGGVQTLFHEEGVRVQNVRPRPGADGVAFVHDGTGFDALYLRRDGDTEQVYAVAGAEVADPAWHPGGDRLAVTVTRDATAHVHEVALDGGAVVGEATAHTGAKAFHTAPRWRGDDVVAVGDTPGTPPAVVNVSADERVAPAGVAGLADRVPEPETLTYESGDREIQAVVYPPEGDAAPESVPLLVKAHGGPTSFDRYRFDWRAGYFAALGYAVVLPNYRGSDGYGRAFRMANDRDWGGGDLDDVVRAADALAAAYAAVDGDRAGIYGGSGGGLMTVNALGRTDRFRAGAAFYGVYDYETFVDDTDDVGWQLMKRELGVPATDPGNYREASPIRHVEDVEAPLLVLHGEADERVPISQSEQLVEELERHDKRFEFRRYEDEPHGFGSRETVVDAYTRVADLFAKYLRVDPDDGSSRPRDPDEASP